MAKKPFVSVIIPVKNRENVIRQNINSVLKQNYDNFEVIVVDDNSTDKTGEIIRGLVKKSKKIKYIKNEKDLGSSASRNVGIEKAKGEIIFFTDSDCEVPENWISEILKHFEEDIAGVGGYLKPGKNTWVAKLESFQNRFLLGIKNKKIVGKSKTPTGYTTNVAYRKKILEEVKGFDDDSPLPVAEDFVLKKKICEKGYKLVYIPLPVIHLQSYDLAYILDRLIIRGLSRNPTEGLFLKTLICFFGMPLITLNISRKILKYKKEKIL